MAALQVAQVAPILTEQALWALKHYQWPGNIRQLQNTLFRAVALNDTGCIEQSDIDTELGNIRNNIRVTKSRILLKHYGTVS